MVILEYCDGMLGLKKDRKLSRRCGNEKKGWETSRDRNGGCQHCPFLRRK
jgi:allantoicase